MTITSTAIVMIVIAALAVKQFREPPSPVRARRFAAFGLLFAVAVVAVIQQQMLPMSSTKL